MIGGGGIKSARNGAGPFCALLAQADVSMYHDRSPGDHPDFGRLTKRTHYARSIMPEPTLNIVLYQPEIPFNAGNCGRTCVAIGAKLWLVRPLGFEVDDRHVRRAGLDYWQHLCWEVVDDWPALLARLPDRQFWFLSKTATTCYTDAQFGPGDALVFGSESKGLPPEMLQGHPGQCLRIPMDARVRSLNLSASMAIVAYEAVRQWRVAGGPA